MILLAAAAVSTLSPVYAEPAPARSPVPDAVVDGLTAQDRDALASAEQLAAEASQVIDQWISSQAVTEARLFARLYFPIVQTEPQKYSTPYDKLADRDLVGIEDRVLARAPAFLYAIVTDVNGYVPAHNTRFAQPLTGDAAVDYVNNRTKRMLGDPASVLAARSDARFMFQRSRLDTGDVIYDVSVPVIVRGKHWGCARIGYRRTE
jgi:methyl-accepting chemotaxis protein